MISENSSPKTQASAFSVFSFFRNLGIFAGTLIGGLAKPADQYPSVFGKVWFFERFPYAFPTLIVGVVVLIALILSIFVVKEVSYARLA
jgi:predicted MFS family arabinose efflux permease